MLTAEENEVLCRVGPGTPMGTVLRRYWTPAFQLGDLPAPDCPPVRVTILGENFVAFRDTTGRLGFLDEMCCHRGASLALGRVEDCGIRCLYHGWKYAVDGTIMETPNLAAPTFRERVKHGAYPVREAGGLAWVYLGPPGTDPPFPAFARRGHGIRPAPGGPGAAAGRDWPASAQLTSRAVTDHVPGLTPRTSAVTATGPLPGTMPGSVPA